MKNSALVVAVLLAIVVVAITCVLVYRYAIERSSEKREELDEGKIEGDRYSNKFFGLSLRIPQGWRALSRESAEKLKEVGAELMVQDLMTLDP